MGFGDPPRAGGGRGTERCGAPGGTCLVTPGMERASWVWSLFSTLAGFRPLPHPCCGRGAPCLSGPLCQCHPGGISLVTLLHAALCTQAGPGCSPHTWLQVAGDPLCPPGDGGPTTASPQSLVGCLVPSTPHTQGFSPAGPGDAHSMAGEGFPLSQLATAGMGPQESWVFGEHRCLCTLGMPRSPQPHSAQRGCWHLGTESPPQPYPTWFMCPLPVCTHHMRCSRPSSRVGFPASTIPVSTPGASALPPCCRIFPHLPSPGNIGRRVPPGSLIYSGSA